MLRCKQDEELRHSSTDTDPDTMTIACRTQTLVLQSAGRIAPAPLCTKQTHRVHLLLKQLAICVGAHLLVALTFRRQVAGVDLLRAPKDKETRQPTQF